MRKEVTRPAHVQDSSPNNTLPNNKIFDVKLSHFAYVNIKIDTRLIFRLPSYFFNYMTGIVLD